MDEKLRAHLQRIEPITDQFCDLYRYSYVSVTRIGKYPRIRIEKSMRKTERVTYWFDLWMNLDDQNRRFTEFFEAIPYELSAGASYYEKFDDLNGFRYSVVYQIFDRVPFCEVPCLLFESMENYRVKLEAWTSESLVVEGEKSPVGTTKHFIEHGGLELLGIDQS